MTRAPHPPLLAQALTQAATTAQTNGERARRMATLLAARGYPNGTLGTGTRTTTSSTSTERAALNPEPWAGIDAKLAAAERLLWYATITYQAMVERLLAHASDDDPIPAGTGSCQRCGRFCRPTAEKPDFRIKSSFCPTCYKQWSRLGRPDRSTFIRTTDEEDVA